MGSITWCHTWPLHTHNTCPYLLSRAASLIFRAKVGGPGGSAFSNILGGPLLISEKLEIEWPLEAEQKVQQALMFFPHEDSKLFLYLKHCCISILEMLRCSQEAHSFDRHVLNLADVGVQPSLERWRTPSVTGVAVTLCPNQLSRIGPGVPVVGPRVHKSAELQPGTLQPRVWEGEYPRVLPGSFPWSIFSLGLQVLLPEYLRERFVAAALSYITCSSEGELICKGNDCWCKCSPTFPECNCPDADIQAMEDSLLQIQDSWATHNRQFEESGEQWVGPDFLPVNGRRPWGTPRDTQVGSWLSHVTGLWPPAGYITTPSLSRFLLLYMQIDLIPTKEIHFKLR